MSHQVVEAIRTGAVPKPAKLAAARAMLPLAPEDALEAIVLLMQDEDSEIRNAANKSLGGFDKEQLKVIAGNKDTAPDVLTQLCKWRGGTREIYEALIINRKTPGEGIAEIAAWQRDGSLLEAITINQERLIDCPAILEAIFANPSKTPEADRRAREVKTEFFEKELGVKRVAEERKARAAAVSAALGLPQAADIVADLIDDDLPVEELFLDDKLLQEQLQMTPSPDVQAQDPVGTLLPEPETFTLPGDALPEMTMEDVWLTMDTDASAEVQRMADEARADGEEISAERLTTMQFIARLNTKQRVQLALKGNREARSILMRDSNKIVVVGVLNNPRINEQEVETITKMRSVPEEALRLIGMNRAWIRSYPLMLNLVRNPRCPAAVSLPLLNRAFPKDLKELAKNRNVPEVIRKAAQRLMNARGIGAS